MVTQPYQRARKEPDWGLAITLLVVGCGFLAIAGYGIYLFRGKWPLMLLAVLTFGIAGVVMCRIALKDMLKRR